MTTIEPTSAPRCAATEQRADIQPESSTVMRRYLVVTAVATPANLVIYVALLIGAGMPALAANIVAATTVSVPAYYVNRAWVWRLGAGGARTAEVVQYWGSTMISLSFSTAALLMLTRAGGSSAVLAAAPLAVYALLWVARYFFLDRYLFRRSAM